MKPPTAFFGLASLLSTLLASDANGQANFWLNNGYVKAPVFNTTGQLIPAGGSYRAELWGSAAVETLQPLRKYSGDNRSFAFFREDGYFSGAAGDLIVVDLAPREMWAWLQVRVWDMSLAPTYEETVQLLIGGYGESAVFYAQGYTYNPYPPGPSAPLIGLQSFTVRPVVPEPAPVALLALGGAALWFVRRRRRYGSARAVRIPEAP